jgi:Holliday junction resolvase RusA-like endonuclease
VNAPLQVTVYGEARPAGALAIGLAKNGRRYLHHRDGQSLTGWKQAITAEVAPHVTGELATCAVSIAATFYVARPAYHFGTGRNAGRLKPSAPAFPVKRSGGDLDKLARALLDALTGIVYRDDSQVVELDLRKRFADSGPIRLELGISPLVGIDEPLSLAA